MPIPIPGRIAEGLRRSTVQVRRSSGHEPGGGSGAVLLHGQIITNAHVVGECREVTVETWEGQTAAATVMRRDPHRDLALLSARQVNAPPLALADSDRVRAGTPVIAVGNPFGFVGAASSGIVSSTGGRWIEADVQLAPGNSGGPLATLQGEVIGINTMVMTERRLGGQFGRGLALAVPSRAVQAFLARARQRRTLGLTVREVRVQGQTPVLLILEIASAGAAERASLLAGDQLVAANGRLLRTTEDLQDAIDMGGETLRVQFRRGGAEAVRETAIILDSEPVTNAA